MLPRLALNDVFVSERNSGRVYACEMSGDDGPVRVRRSSGLLFATGTGSGARLRNQIRVDAAFVRHVLAEAAARGAVAGIDAGTRSGAAAWLTESECVTIAESWSKLWLMGPDDPRMVYSILEPIVPDCQPRKSAGCAQNRRAAARPRAAGAGGAAAPLLRAPTALRATVQADGARGCNCSPARGPPSSWPSLTRAPVLPRPCAALRRPAPAAPRAPRAPRASPASPLQARALDGGQVAGAQHGAHARRLLRAPHPVRASRARSRAAPLCARGRLPPSAVNAQSGPGLTPRARAGPRAPFPKIVRPARTGRRYGDELTIAVGDEDSAVLSVQLPCHDIYVPRRGRSWRDI